MSVRVALRTAMEVWPRLLIRQVKHRWPASGAARTCSGYDEHSISWAPRTRVWSRFSSIGGCWTIAIWTSLPAMERLCAVEELHDDLRSPADAQAEPAARPSRHPHRPAPGFPGHRRPVRVTGGLAL